MKKPIYFIPSSTASFYARSAPRQPRRPVQIQDFSPLYRPALRLSPD